MSSEILKKITVIDNMRVFTNYLSLQDIHLHSSMDVELVVEQKLENTQASLEKDANECLEYVLAKRYMDTEELENDNDKDIFFDTKYDITRYMVLDEF